MTSPYEEIRITKRDVRKRDSGSPYVDLSDDLNELLSSERGRHLSLSFERGNSIVRLPDGCVVDSITGDERGPILAFTNLTILGGIFAHALLDDPFTSRLSLRQGFLDYLIAGQVTITGGQTVLAGEARSDIVALRAGSISNLSGRGKIIGGIGGAGIDSKEVLYLERYHRGIEYDGSVRVVSSTAAMDVFRFRSERKELIDEILANVQAVNRPGIRNRKGKPRGPRL
jgi:hypothetical protein